MPIIDMKLTVYEMLLMIHKPIYHKKIGRYDAPV